MKKTVKRFKEKIGEFLDAPDSDVPPAVHYCTVLAETIDSMPLLECFNLLAIFLA